MAGRSCAAGYADRAVERAQDAGAELLEGPLTTDWGTQAAYLRGPGNLVVDVCRDA
ncbi:hypothetical protein [Flexivirga caeni]|uniref:hypothetical protein n=1 Tax=Flexivirga caeni TaxID=2294115 RepID=UPI0013151FD4|nr:hypothetical protein [Flexivirga caeni]